MCLNGLNLLLFHSPISLCLQTPNGSEYVMVTPDVGLMYPVADYFCTTVNKAGMIQGNSSLPVVINCTYIKAMDYTTALVVSHCHEQ
jgi:hypothetical protein